MVQNIELNNVLDNTIKLFVEYQNYSRKEKTLLKEINAIIAIMANTIDKENKKKSDEGVEKRR